MTRKRLGGLLTCLVGALVFAGSAEAANPASKPTSNGQTLNVEIVTPANGTKTQSSTIPVTGKVSLGPIPTTAAILYVVDNSGSTYDDAGQNDCNGDGAVTGADDFNADGLNGATIDCEIAGVQALNTSLGSAVQTQAGIVGFGSSAIGADVGPATKIQPFTTPKTDADGNGRTDIDDVMGSFGHANGVSTIGLFTPRQFFGGTSFARAVEVTDAMFGFAPGADTKVAYLLSDGDGFDAQPQAQAAAADGIVINTFSVGAQGTGCGSNDGVKTELQEIADITGGTCTEVNDPSDLQDELAGQKPAGIEKVRLSVNGGPQQDATLDALGNFSGTVGPLQPGLNIIWAEALATDGTKVAANIAVVRQLATQLKAEPTVARVLPGLQVNLGELRARLTAGQAPVPGKKIVFTGALGKLCEATTDVNGVARCTNLLTSLQAILSLRYNATFAGDSGPVATYLPSQHTGVLIELSSIRIL